MESESGVHFLNVAYFFRLIYDLFSGGGSAPVGSVSLWPAIVAFISGVWILLTILGYLLALAALFLLVHASMRMYQAQRDEAPKYATRKPEEEEVRRDHNRWDHVIELIESPHENDWRQAIIEADIMLDDLLTQLGYAGESVGEKLRSVDPARFSTLQDAWEGHKVRNEIAHKGSAYQLTDHLAYRTIHHYEAVMREHGEI